MEATLSIETNTTDINDTAQLIQALRDKIETQQATIGVIGLGYVGLPVACEFARVGFSVIGLDVKLERISKIAQGISPIEGNEPGLAELLAEVVKSGQLHPTLDAVALARADVITINVETPVDDTDHKPRYAALRAACEALGAVLKRGALVIVESTIAPGTVSRVVQPILEAASGMRANQDFFLGACPERVMPGKLLSNLRTIGRVCGGSTPEIAEAMAALYRQVVNAPIDIADVVTAELVKTTENAYRDVQIAFANEVALICESVGADVYKVRELVNKVPQRNMHMPGAGVGGHCIPKDPWLLASAAGPEVPIRLIPAARAINEGMPLHVADLLMQALHEQGVSVSYGSSQRVDGSVIKVAVLGYAYLENSDDTRHSPSAVLIAHLQAHGFAVAVHDPWVEEYKGDVYERVRGCDAALIMVAHSVYRLLDVSILQKETHLTLLVDARNLIGSMNVNAGLQVLKLGRSSQLIATSY